MKAYIVVGLSNGDEGKGSMTDFLVRRHGARLVVRYNGACQAAHNVVLPDGTHHTFAQFGSGTFAGARTHLAKTMLIEPYAMINEAEVLRPKIKANPFELLTVDPLCPVITPYHWALNRIREILRGKGRHGSCGFGVGELRAMQDAGEPVLCAYRLWDRRLMLPVLQALQQILTDKVERLIAIGKPPPEIDKYLAAMREDPKAIADRYHDWTLFGVTMQDEDGLRAQLQKGPTVFEGAQGVLLDENHGFAPYNTWTDTTARHATAICKDAGLDYTTIGVTRTHATRHGPGPFPTEQADLKFEDHNCEGEWQGKFRFGYFDLVMFRYATHVCPVDEIALTRYDDLDGQGEWRWADKYDIDAGGATTTDLMQARPVYQSVNLYHDPDLDVDFIEDQLEVPVRYLSGGPTHIDKLDWGLRTRRIKKEG
jgi:adenylosuccinate synthase